MTNLHGLPRQRGVEVLLSRLIMAVIIIGCGCATIPEGELQLGPKIVRDMKASRTSTKALNKGRPIYAEAYTYPQMLETGDIWAGGPLLINLGREDISLDTLINPITPVPQPVAARKVTPNVKHQEGNR
jgi:hypothetical protein